jgi:undecaprenyl-diphosphatase
MISVFHFLTFFGSSNFLFIAYILLVIWLFFNKRKNDGIDILIVGITSTLLMFGLKNIFRRHRPEFPLFKELSSYSFPSGHALSSFVFCSVLIWLTWQTHWKPGWKWVLTILLVAFSISIGISRIVLRYHYASDVVAGFSLGFAWVLLSLWVQQKFRPKSL